jgi:hypothetical protein
MNSNNNQENKIQYLMKPEFNELKTYNLGNVISKNCSYCNNPFTEGLWCKNCDPFNIMEGWSSGNSDIDKFIKDTMYSGIEKEKHRINYYQFRCLEWVPFDRFKDIEKIGEGGSTEVYSAMWTDGRLVYEKYCGWTKLNSKPIKVALKKLNKSIKISEYLNEV